MLLVQHRMLKGLLLWAQEGFSQPRLMLNMHQGICKLDKSFDLSLKYNGFFKPPDLLYGRSVIITSLKMLCLKLQKHYKI